MSDTTERQTLTELIGISAPLKRWIDYERAADNILDWLTAHDAAICADAWDEGAAKAMENGYLMRNGHVPNPYRTRKGDGE